MEPMTLAEIAAACNGTLIGAENTSLPVTSITIDSRKASEGSLYIPVKGETHDGHVFIKSAFENGAACTLSEHDEPYCHIKVESTFQALKDIAEYYRSKFDVTVIGITGSVGKTTAKDMIAAVLNEQLNVLKTEGNFNNEFGLPQMLFRLNRSHDAAVLEMGMNSFGEISRLSKTARPDIAVIINIGVSHIGRLGSRDGILKAKSEIFDYLKSDGKVYLYGGDDKLITLKNSRYQPVYFGEDAHNQARVKEIIRADITGTELTAEYKDESYHLHIPYPGTHLIPSALAAVAIAHDLGLKRSAIEAGVKAFAPSKMRMDIINTENIVILNDVYNACPESIMAALRVLAYGKGRKVAILGDILELDDHAERIHHETGKSAAKTDTDLIICCGTLSKDMYKGAKSVIGDRAIYFETQDEMLENLELLIQKGDTVLVKASRGLAFEHTVAFLKTHFS